jgi:asparagine synthase (glutamine-hydrolysing)
MCGILFHQAREALSALRYEAALLRMRRRGPDHRALEQGRVAGRAWALGHTRLAIIDLSPEAHQPFADASGRFRLAFNGEIYNHAELRAELEAQGLRFRTRSDTEVLLQALLHFGPEAALPRLRGMFAFVLFDTESGELLAARDHFGQKPLFYREDAGSLALASDPRALLELGAACEPELDAYPTYLCPAGASGTRGVFPVDRSFFRGIRMLPAGHLLRAGIPRAGGSHSVRLHEYFHAVELFDRALWRRNAERPQAELADELRGLLRQAVERHLVADVGVGILLSGGLDSTLVYWLAHECAERVVAFTKLSPGIEEIPLRVVPQVLERRTGDAHFIAQDPREYLPALVEFLCFSAAPSRWGTGPPMASLCAAARQNDITVLLGGDCSDEMWGGYAHYEAALSAPAASLFEPSELTALNKSSPFYDAKRCAFFDSRERATRERIAAALGEISDPQARQVQAALLHDTSTFLQTISLPHSDLYAMLHSVELRNPMLDLDLARFVVNLPIALRAGRHPASGHFGKVMLRDLADHEIGPFMNQAKEGTRNYSMRMVETGYWETQRFALAKLFPLPPVESISKKDLLRLVNLELFHRLFFEGGVQSGGEFVHELLTPAGRGALLGRPIELEGL